MEVESLIAKTIQLLNDHKIEVLHHNNGDYNRATANNRIYLMIPDSKKNSKLFRKLVYVISEQLDKLHSTKADNISVLEKHNRTYETLISIKKNNWKKQDRLIFEYKFSDYKMSVKARRKTQKKINKLIYTTLKDLLK